MEAERLEGEKRLMRLGSEEAGRQENALSKLLGLGPEEAGLYNYQHTTRSSSRLQASSIKL